MSVASGTVRSSAPSTTPLILNIETPATPLEEFSFIIPANVKQFIIRSRYGSKLLIAFNLGGTSTLYFTLNRNVSLSQENLSAADLEIFMVSDQISDTIEVLYWN